MGKKILDFFKGEVISSVFYLTFGLCLILIPDQTVNIICKIIFGLVMIAAGIYHIIIYTAEKRKATILDLFTGVIVMVLGIFLFFTPQIVIRILPYLLGAFVLVDSIWKIKGSYRLKKAEKSRWKVLFIGCLIFIALGASLLFYSFLSVTKMILFSGMILTANGAADIVFLIMLCTGMRKRQKEQSCDVQMEGMPQDGQKPAVEEKALTDEMSPDMADQSSEEVQTESEESENAEEKDREDMTQDTDQADLQDIKEAVTDNLYDMKEEESPGREIREMLKSHDETLEEWKD